MSFLPEADYETTREWRMYRSLIEYIEALYYYHQPTIPGVVERFQEFGRLFMDQSLMVPRLTKLLGERGIAIPETAEWFLVGWRERYGDGYVAHNDKLPRPSKWREGGEGGGGGGNVREEDPVYEDSLRLEGALGSFLEDVSQGEPGLVSRKEIRFTNGRMLPLEFYWCQSHNTMSFNEWGEVKETIDYLLVKREDLYRIYYYIFGVEPDSIYWISRRILNDWEWAVETWPILRISYPVLADIRKMMMQEYYLKRKIGPRYGLPSGVVRLIMGSCRPPRSPP